MQVVYENKNYDQLVLASLKICTLISRTVKLDKFASYNIDTRTCERDIALAGDIVCSVNVNAKMPKCPGLLRVSSLATNASAVYFIYLTKAGVV